MAVLRAEYAEYAHAKLTCAACSVSWYGISCLPLKSPAGLSSSLTDLPTNCTAKAVSRLIQGGSLRGTTMNPSRKLKSWAPPWAPCGHTHTHTHTHTMHNAEKVRHVAQRWELCLHTRTYTHTCGCAGGGSWDSPVILSYSAWSIPCFNRSSSLFGTTKNSQYGSLS